MRRVGPYVIARGRVVVRRKESTLTDTSTQERSVQVLVGQAALLTSLKYLCYSVRPFQLVRPIHEPCSDSFGPVTCTFRHLVVQLIN